MAGAEQCVLLARDQAALLKRRAEVVGLLVPHHRARVMLRREVSANDFVKRERIGTGQLNNSVQRLRDNDSGQVSHEVGQEDWLKQRRGRVAGLPGGRLITK